MDWIGGLRWGTTTSQTFWGKDYGNTGGTLAVWVDGVKAEGGTLSADNDYTGTVTVTGLSQGSHSYQMGYSATGPETTAVTFQTLPDAGEDFDLVFGGDCQEDSYAMAYVLENESPRAFILNGDIGYLDSDSNDYDSCGDVDLGTLAAYRCHWRRRFDPDRLARGLTGKSNQNFLAMQSRYPTLFQWHDHEINDDRIGIGTLGADTRLDNALQAAREYALNGLPANAASQAGPPATDTAPDPLLYWSTTMGGLRIIQMDMITYAYNQLGDGYGTDTGTFDKQAGWVANEIATATEDFILLIAPASWKTSDESGMPTVRQAVIDKAGVTVVCIAADAHGAYATQVFVAGTADNETMLEVIATPFHHESSWNVPGALPGGDSDSPHTSDATGFVDRFGLLRFRPNGTAEFAFAHIELQIKTYTGKVMFRGVVKQGERRIQDLPSVGMAF